MNRRQLQKEQHMVRAKRILCLIEKDSQLHHPQPPSEPVQTETTHTPVKRLRLQGKQSQAQSDGGKQSQAQNRESSVTAHVDASQPMDLSGYAGTRTT